MRAVLLAAGLGTRLAPYTDSAPKVLVTLGDRPLLQHQLEYLARQGVSDVAVNLHHRAEQVLDFLDGYVLPVPVRVSLEKQLLGTAGALDHLRGFVTDTTIVLYGDVVTDADLGAIVDEHERAGAAATLTYYVSSSVEGKGLLELDHDGRVLGFVEKPQAAAASGLVNAGLYVITPRVLAYVRPGADFGHDVWPAMLAAGELLHGYKLDAYLRDVGSPDALRQTGLDLAEGALRW